MKAILLVMVITFFGLLQWPIVSTMFNRSTAHRLAQMCHRSISPAIEANRYYGLAFQFVVR